MVVALNMGPQPLVASLPPEIASGQILLSSFLDREGHELINNIDLRGNEGLLVKMDC